MAPEWLNLDHLGAFLLYKRKNLRGTKEKETARIVRLQYTTIGKTYYTEIGLFVFVAHF